MVSFEERIGVDIDTREAKATLRGLHKDKARGAKRVRNVARSGSRLAIRSAGFVSAGAVPSFDNAPAGGRTDPLDEALVPFYAKAQAAADKALGYSAAGRRAAREQTKAAFAYEVGRRGMSANVNAFFNTANRIRQDVESGRNILRQDPRFLGPDLTDVSSAMLTGEVERFFANLEAVNPIGLIAQGFAYIVDGITRD